MPPHYHDLKCWVCGEPFKAKYKWARYCKAPCKQIAKAERERENRARYKARHPVIPKEKKPPKRRSRFEDLAEAREGMIEAKPAMTRCLKCDRLFYSYDTKNNRICPHCAKYQPEMPFANVHVFSTRRSRRGQIKL